MENLTDSIKLDKHIREKASDYEKKLKATITKKGLISDRDLVDSVKVTVSKEPDGWKVTVWFEEHGRIIENLSYRKNKIKHKEESIIYRKPSKFWWFRRNQGVFVTNLIEDLTTEFLDEITDKFFHVLDYFKE